MNSLSLIRRVAAVSVVALLLGGCSASGSDAEAGSKLTLAIAIDANSFDPKDFFSSGQYHPYFQAVYDSLLRYEADGKIMPGLATKWEYNSDKTVLTLTLRDGVTFSDGEKFTAAAAKANLDHVKSAQTAISRRLALVSSIETSGDTTLVLTLSAPEPGLLYYLANEVGFMASPRALGTKGLVAVPVGSGPYVLDEQRSVRGSEYVFTAREHYWNPALQTFKEVDIRPMSDVTARLNALISGQVNGAALDAKTVKQAEAAGATATGGQSTFEGFFLFDRGGKLTPALADVRVRQAINYAVDGKAILDKIYGGKGTTTSQVFAPGSDAYVPELDRYYSYDPDKARRLLAEAGFAKGFTLRVPTSATADPTLLAIVGQQLSTVGITLEQVGVPPADSVTVLVGGQFPASYFPEVQNIAWVNARKWIAPTGSLNPFHTTDDTVTNLLHTMQVGDDAVAADAAKQLNRYIVEQAWFAPFYRQTDFYYTKGGVTATAQRGGQIPALYNFAPAK